MSRLLLDTHSWFWFVGDKDNLPISAKRQIEIAHQVFVSSISVYEIGQKLRLGRWPGMSEDILDAMIGDASAGIEYLELDMALAKRASLLDWAHRDPFDRMLAATAMDRDLAIVSKDAVFDSLEGLRRIWRQ